ncbi:hypothetical protein EYF80_059385 [Scomber scombrus]|uniref:Interleukin-12 subunit alpha n=1 Tax=Scomber scombrus TaxID=13677 RepID=A0AAV1NWS2_SCOSC
MAFAFATFAAVFLLLATASCAPAGTQDACADVRKSSLELNRIAKTVSELARNGSKDMSDVSASLLWMEANDMCDPGTLKHEPVTCVRKIFKAIRSYKSVLKTVDRFPCCSGYVSSVKKALHNMETDMGKCVKLSEAINHQEESHTSNGQGIRDYEQLILCHYTMDRLFSFSILAARVFAVGDPAHHTEGSVQKCM